jgi:hypothetical protein
MEHKMSDDRVSGKEVWVLWIGLILLALFVAYLATAINRGKVAETPTVTSGISVPVPAVVAPKAEDVKLPAYATPTKPITVLKTAKPVKAVAGVCSKAEKAAYAIAFANAERANQLLGRIAYVTGPGPCR